MFNKFAQNNANITALKLVEHSQYSTDGDIVGPFTEVYFAPDQARISLTPSRGPQGLTYNYQVSAKIPALQSAIRLVAETNYNRYVVIVTDANGTSYVLGQYRRGYRISINGEVNETENTLMLNLAVTSGLPFHISEELQNAINADFVIMNTIMIACNSTEAISENKTVFNLGDGDTISHSLNSESIAITFFENGIKRDDVVGTPITPSVIKATLPTPDGTSYTFTGEVFIEKRNPILS
jgi:hypothetical protein